ncbi:MAG: SemiSWEET family transporter [Candidatus Uhrbacteria bacterium]
MNTLFIETIGYVAGVLIVVSLIPQVVQSWRTKETHDISLWRYILYTLGLALLVVYGFLIWSLPIALLNIVATFLATIILYLKIKYK